MKTCKSVVPTDDEVYGYETPYYKITLANTAQLYCLQCCGTNPLRVDNWNLRCVVDSFTATTSNLYGYEFRMGTQSYFGAFDFISCPLKRSACTYTSSGGLIGCAATDKTYLHGYVLDLSVIRYTSNFMSWRGISSCQATAIESNISLSNGNIFEESIRMNWVSAPFQITQTLNLALFSIFGVLIFYAALFFIRKKHCPVCLKKIVLFPNRCVVCVFLGADMPDPVLQRALEAKGRRIIDGNSRPALTHWQSLLEFKNDSVNSISYWCYPQSRTRRRASVHITVAVTEKMGAMTDRKGSRTVPRLPLELPSHTLIRSKIDSPEKRYYRSGTNENEIEKSKEKEMEVHSFPEALPIASLDLESASSSSSPLPMLRNFFNRATVPIGTTADAPVSREGGPIISRKVENFSLNSPSLNKVVASISPHVKNLATKLHVHRKNPRNLPFSEDAIIDAIDDEFTNRKSNGISKNKFIIQTAKL